MLPASEPLDRLTALDPRLLYLFVVGPRYGEALAVRLPGMGWLLVDCCCVKAVDGSEILPQEVIVTRFAPEPVMAALLTHPHEDHVTGFPDLLHRLKPAQVMVSGGNPPAKNLVEAVEEQIDRAAGTRERTIANQVKQAVQAIRRWELQTQKKVTALQTGTTLWPSPVSVVCRAPDMTAAASLLQGNSLATRANELSAVLEIEWEKTRLVLGGDLPHVTTAPKNPIVIPTGWDRVMRQRPELVDHTGLKVPHHASWAAMHCALMRPSPNQPRAWIVTPHHKGKKLPSLDVGDGIDLLHIAEPSVMVTREPRVAAGKPTWTLPALRASISRPNAANPIVNRGALLNPVTSGDPLEAVWAVAFDDAGRVVARYCGAGAFDVVR